MHRHPIIALPAVVLVAVLVAFTGSLASAPVAAAQDSKATIEFAESELTVYEGGATPDIRFVSQGSGDVEVSVAVAPGSALAEADYQMTTYNLLGIAASVSGPLQIVDDDESEDDEFFTLYLTGDPSYIGAQSKMVVRIVDDDKSNAPRGTLELKAESGVDYDDRQIIVFSVDRVGGTNGSLTARFVVTTDGTADGNDISDGWTTPNEFTLLPGETSWGWTVYVVEDGNTGEPEEYVLGYLDADDPSVLGNSIKVQGFIPADPPLPDPTATPEPEPTATPVPQPTATPEPEPTATPVPQPTAAPEPEPTATVEPAPQPTAEPEADPEPTAASERVEPATEPEAPAGTTVGGATDPDNATAEPDPTATVMPAPAPTGVERGVVDDSLTSTETVDAASQAEASDEVALAAASSTTSNSSLGILLILMGVAVMLVGGAVFFASGRSRSMPEHF